MFGPKSRFPTFSNTKPNNKYQNIQTFKSSPYIAQTPLRSTPLGSCYSSSFLASAMESTSSPSNPVLSLSTFLHHHCHRLGAELATRIDETRRFAGDLAAKFPQAAQRALLSPLPWPNSPSSQFLPFASVSQREGRQGKQSYDTSPSSDRIAKRLTGTAVYTVSNNNNEFVLISDPGGVKSIGLLCFRREDAEAFLAQVRARKKEVRGGAKVVPITLDQVYLLKVEGIAFRFLPDPVQIKNALELKASDMKAGFDGVPVFQSDLLVVKKKNKRYCPIYFCKEDIERELSLVPKASRGPGVSQHILVASLEDVLRKMETSEKNSGWEDLIFIPPGKSHSQHIQDVTKA